MNYLVERVPVRDATTKFRQVNDSEGGLGDVNRAVHLSFTYLSVTIQALAPPSG